MHTILGAGGPISKALAKELAQSGIKANLASRREIKTRPSETWIRTDLLNEKDVLNATKGSEVIYLCAGLVYDKRIWREQWPVVMQNVITASKAAQARLIFFDNVYMYGKVDGPMLESTPYNPCSEKGEVRAKIATRLMEEVKAGHLLASIARSADFYGATDTMNSFFDMMVLDKYSKKEKAMWLGNPETLHSFTYVPDAGKAMFLLGQESTSDNQIWHLPTARAITGKEFINTAAGIFKVKPSYMKVNKLMLRALGLFNKAIEGTVEMYYQYQHNYHFDSSKFENHFSFHPTTYKEGIEHLFSTYYKAERD
ncbi:NAD-dependent epimerase/dehydratase family protein [Desertivirga brevis]|uniref:NAD-dependent epimerase/dehydratase family protein n=1 Tax=Desertivirga brevis TaxID=2810310 RepID=UPI001A97B36A|nr:NAD-dependent epimerase/dehydratase family protein [Pedobacter sp. SYSU D00873]